MPRPADANPVGHHHQQQVGDLVHDGGQIPVAERDDVHDLALHRDPEPLDGAIELVHTSGGPGRFAPGRSSGETIMWRPSGVGVQTNPSIQPARASEVACCSHASAGARKR
jgi:hypothetical protein